MPTTKKRINITANADIEAALKKAAKRDKIPVATKAAELLHLALEIEEDIYWANIADERRKSRPKRLISHKDVWK